MRVYSDKQLEFITKWQSGGLSRINILEGSVRSGKTYISLVLWALWVWSMPIDGAYLMCAKTLTSLRRNCLDLLKELVGGNFSYSLAGKEASLFGRKVYLEGCNDIRSEGKIRGMTLQGAYCDELTLFTEDFFAMLLSRLSQAGAKLIASTNPDSPSHWLKEKYLDRADELDLLSMRFTIDDNPFLDPEYVANLKKEYTGVFYSRYIQGDWVRAEGLIYDMFDPDVHVVPSELRKYSKYYVSCDYGTQNPTTFGLWGLHKDVWYKTKEYHYSGREENRQKTDKEFADDYVKFVGGLPITAVIVDPSAASFIAELKSRYIPVKQADNAVLDGIRLTASCLKTGRIKICGCCKETIREFGLYVWDEKAAGEDKPIKENDHHMDDTRYFCQTMMRGSAIEILR